ncbi:MAG: glycosyltransferase [Candidatus Paceibacterota bacterium]
MNKKQPQLISVILPVHNGEQYVGQAIQSILDQTYKNFELLILISATTNKESLDVINSFNDNRIRLIFRTADDNLPKALNLGIKEAKGEYIARMDADDISLPKRLEKQVEFMNSHPEVGLCGSWCKSFGYGKSTVNKVYTNPEDIRASLLFNTSLIHPSVMIKKSLFDKFCLSYNENLNHGEDYDLWSRCTNFFHVANIDKVLLKYRIHDKSTSQIFKKETSDVATNIRLRLLNKIDLKPSEEEIRLHNSILPKEYQTIKSFIEKEDIWLSKIISQNIKSNIYNSDSLNKIVYKRWRTICGFNTTQGLKTWKAFKTSPLYKLVTNKKSIDNIKILIKSILKM